MQLTVQVQIGKMLCSATDICVPLTCVFLLLRLLFCLAGTAAEYSGAVYNL